MGGLRNRLSKYCARTLLILVLSAAGAARAQPTFVDSFGSGVLGSPNGVALSAGGSVYVTNSSTGGVVTFTADGALSSSFATGNPFGVAVGNGGKIYVTDQTARNIGIFNSSGTSLGTIGSSGVGQGQFSTPAGIAIGPDGTIYVTDNGLNKVQVFNSSGVSQSQFGSGATLGGPLGIAVVGGTLYVTNANLNNIVPFTNGGGTAGAPIATSPSPVGIGVGNGGNLYVANFGNNTISVFDSATNTLLSTFGASQANVPTGVAVSKTGSIYVTNLGSGQVDRYFAPSEWVAAGTNNFGQLALKENVTLQNGYALNVSGDSALTSGATLTVGAGSTFTTNSLTFGDGATTGTLKVTAPTFSSSAAINLNGNMNVDTAAGSTVTLSGFITDISSGSNSDLVKSGAGTLILDSGGNSYNDTFITGGTLQADCCSIGAGNIILSNNARLVLDQTLAGPGFIFGEIVGNGSLRVQGSDAVGLANINTYTGGTIVTDTATLAAVFGGSLPTTGPLQVSSGATVEFSSGDATIGSLGDFAGSGGSVALDGPMTLTVGDATNTVFSGVISECGCNPAALVKQGSGSLTLNGVNTFTGGTTITAGTLAVGDAAHPGASLASGVTLTGGTLQGHGSILGPVTNNAGIVKPGGSIGTLTVGSFTQGGGGTTAITLSPGAGSRLAVTGAASLNGTLALQPQAGFYPRGTSYRILTAGGGVTGTFATITSTLPATFALAYLQNEVNAQVTTSNGTSLATGTQTRNQGAIARVLDTASVTTTDSDLINLLVTLSGLPPSQQAHAFDELNGEIRSATFTAARQNLRGFLGSLSEQLGGGLDFAGPGPQGAALAPIAGNRAVVAWSRVYGSFGQIRGNANSSSVTGHTAGAALGIETAVDRDTTAGLALGYGHSSFSLKSTPQRTEFDSTGVAAYGERRFGPTFIDASAALAYNHDDTKRGVDFAGLSRQASSSSDGVQAGASLTLGYRWRHDRLLVEPQANLIYSFVHQGGFTESDAGAANLQVDAKDDSAVQSILGTRLAQEFDASSGVLTPELRLGWAHEYTNVTPQATARFAVAPSAGSFSASGANPGSDGALIGIGISHSGNSGLMLFARYDADLHTHATNHAATVGVKLAW